MDSLDNFRERFEALEQQTEQLKHHTHALEAHTRTIERRLRLWRGMACGLLILGLVSLPLPSGTAQDEQPTAAEYKALKQRLAVLEYKLAHVTGGPDDVTITGANLRIINGLGATNTTNGLGNLIVGYNEERGDGTDNRTGSHNVVVGRQHNFSSFGGLVVAQFNEISGPWASVSGGEGNTASGLNASVSGGRNNRAEGKDSSITGGDQNAAFFQTSSVSGGVSNAANGISASVSGGFRNNAFGPGSSICGGRDNLTNSPESSISGGRSNIANGDSSSVSGGLNRTAPAANNWAAGALFSDN